MQMLEVETRQTKPGEAEFTNEALTDFSKPENAEAFRVALREVAGQLGQKYPLIIGGERILTEKLADSINPAKPTQVIGQLAQADVALANRAVEVAAETFKTW